MVLVLVSFRPTTPTSSTPAATVTLVLAAPPTLKSALDHCEMVVDKLSADAADGAAIAAIEAARPPAATATASRRRDLLGWAGGDRRTGTPRGRRVGRVNFLDADHE